VVAKNAASPNSLMAVSSGKALMPGKDSGTGKNIALFKGPAVWPLERLAAVEALWGEGFVQPGGAFDIQRLVNPFGLSAASTLMLVGGGTEGALRTVLDLGPWVVCYEADPELMAIAATRKMPSKLARRANIQALNADAPNLKPGYFHHGLVLQPFRYVKQELLLSSCERALKPYGHLVVLDLVADRSSDLANPAMQAWLKAEGRTIDPPAAASVTRSLTRLGFDVHVMEDLSRHQERLALNGWSRQLRRLEGARPQSAYAMALVQEAERWMLRLRLMRDGHLKLMRWHAVKSGRRVET
jgi:hypothetical protein